MSAALPDASAPQTPAEFLARRNLPDRKRLWVPIIWGPSYTSGAAARPLGLCPGVQNEGRYKLTPALFAAVRWNQQFFGDVGDTRVASGRGIATPGVRRARSATASTTTRRRSSSTATGDRPAISSRASSSWPSS